MLYGRIQPGGLVEYVTKKPQAAAHYSFQQQFGSWGQVRSVLDATGAVNDVLRAVSAARHHEERGGDKGPERQLDDTLCSLGKRLRWKLGGNRCRAQFFFSRPP